MKKIGLWTMSLLAVGAVALTSCDADRDDNPSTWPTLLPWKFRLRQHRTSVASPQRQPTGCR